MPIGSPAGESDTSEKLTTKAMGQFAHTWPEPKTKNNKTKTFLTFECCC